jgi:hypothetical protein
VLATLTLTACGGDNSGPSSAGGDGAPVFALHNSADHSIWYVQTRACGVQAWSQDLLGADVVSVGETFRHAVGAGCHDVRLRTDPDLSGEVVWSSITFVASDTVSMTLDAWSYTQ